MEVELVEDREFEQLQRLCHFAEQRSTGPLPRLLPPPLTPAIPPKLPFLTFKGETRYCCDSKSIEDATRYVRAVRPVVVGLDMEWRVIFKVGMPTGPVALIQLSFTDPSRCLCGQSPYICLLLHISAIGGPTDSLLQLLSDESILKAGVGITNDCLKLGRDYGAPVANAVDLSNFANDRLTSDHASPPNWSLAALVERLLHHRLCKSRVVRCSNWEKVPLTGKQRVYAATDAWASLRVYEELSRLPKSYPPRSPTACGVASGIGARPAAATPAVDASDLEDIIIPGCYLLGRLQPGKLLVHGMHMAGQDVTLIASERQIAPGTVQSYLTDAIIAGFSYRMRLLGIFSSDVETVAEVAQRVVGKKLCATRVAALKDSYELRSAPWDLMSILLSHVDGSIRRLQEELFERRLNYGDLRVAVAHLGRLNSGMQDKD